MKSHVGFWSVVSLLIIAVCLLASAVQAEEKTSKSRAIRHLTKIETIKVGEGHVIGVNERSGLATFENGEVATTITQATFDDIRGNGTHQGYAQDAFEDGSTYTAKFQETHTSTDAGKTATFEGRFKYLSGTGRFNGIKGDGIYTGKRYLSGKADGDDVVDVTGTSTVPSM
jgi:hypothetical protein